MGEEIEETAKKPLWELTHLFTVEEGFKQNIPPEVISNPYNLEYVPIRLNKGKCRITKKELYRLYNLYKKTGVFDPDIKREITPILEV